MSDPPGSQPGKPNARSTAVGRTLRPRNTGDSTKQKNQRVNDTETGLKWLLDHQFATKSSPDIPTLVTAMHDMAQMDGLPDQYREGVHAFAYVIFSTYESLNQLKHEESLDSMKKFISHELSEMKEAVVKEVNAAKDEIHHDLHSNICELKQLDRTQDSARRTYAQALLSQTQQTKTQQSTCVVERCEKNTRLLTLKPMSGLEHDPTENLTDVEILEKARLALENMDTTSCPVTPRFLSARKAKTNAITYELNDSSAVKWLSLNQHRETFLQGFGGSMDMRPKTFQVIAEFTPVSFDPSDTSEIRRVEIENDLPQNVITRASWIKPIQRRRPGQRTAHIILNFSDPGAANTAIRHGIVILGNRTQVRKKPIEPM